MKRKLLRLLVMLMVSAFLFSFVSAIGQSPSLVDNSTSGIHKNKEIFEGGFSPEVIVVAPNEVFNVDFSIYPTKDAPNTVIQFIVPDMLVQLVEGTREWIGDVEKGEPVSLSFSFATKGEVKATVRADVNNDKKYSSSFFLQIATANAISAEGAGKIKPVSPEEMASTGLNAESTRAPPNSEIMGSSMGATVGSDEIRVYGTFSYANDLGGYSPARYMNVRIMEKNAGADNQIWSGWTNASGSYDRTIDNIDPEGGNRDIYVQLWAIGQWDWETKTGAGATYYWSTSVTYNAAGGSTLYKGGVPASNNEAVLCGDACFAEAQWIYDRVGWARPNRVVIRWPYEDWPHCHGEEIHMPATWGGGHVTVQHEYAHAVMWDLYGNSWPNGAIFDDHWVTMEWSNRPAAFAEGFAEFMQCAVDNNPNNLQAVGQNIETNTWYNYQDTGDMDGDWIEGCIASILWDIYDPVNIAGDNDHMGWGFDELFTVLKDGDTGTDDNPNNILEFWTDWESRWPTISTSLGPLCDMYWNYGIDKDYLPWGKPWGGTISINGGATYTTSKTVTLTLFCDDWGCGVKYMRFSEDDGSTWGSWVAYSTTYSYTIQKATDGFLWVDVQFMDYWFTTDSGTIYDGITVDTVNPTGSIIINSGNPATTTTTAVTLYLTYADATSGVKEVRYGNAGGSWSAWMAPTATKAWTLTSGAGLKYVYYQVKDNAGRVSQYYDTITLVSATVDTVIVFSLSPNPATPSDLITLSGTLKTVGGAAVYPASVLVEYSLNGGVSWSSVGYLGTNAAGQFSVSSTAPVGNYLFRVSYAGSASYNPSSSTQTLVVATGGSATIEVSTEKTTYSLGETMHVYGQIKNPGSAVSLRVILKVQLPDTSTYTMIDMVVAIPAGSDTGTVGVGTYVLSGIPTGSYKWIAEIRNPTTNALIDDDTWNWQIV